MTRLSSDRLEVLTAARRVADFASAQGVPSSFPVRRSTYGHVGALFADAVLQAGLSYHSVVMPRIGRILKEFPDVNRIGALIYLIKSGDTAHFLDWTHSTKLKRFEYLVYFFHHAKIDTATEIRNALMSPAFCNNLRSVNGIGPKTIDYISCLVGIESIAVDRHIRSFAIRAGLDHDDYGFLKDTFCFAADFLSISRREFDAWVWSSEIRNKSPQMNFAF